jgi:alpha-galactosidase
VFRVSGGGTGPQPATTTVVSQSSGRCLDLPDGATANGTQPIIWDCNGGANQRWTADGQTWQALGKCLDAPPGAIPGSKAQIWDCNGGANQRWNTNGDGTVSNTQNGLCLDVDRNLTANGTKVLLWTCSGATNQRWTRRS